MPNFSEIANEAKSFACTLYKNQPGALIPNPVSDVLHHVWDSFCGDSPPSPSPGLPSPAAPPFQGGRCCATFYMVYYDRQPDRNGPWVLNYYQGQIRGVIGAMQSRLNANGQVDYFHTYTSCAGVVTEVPIIVGNVQGDNKARINRVEPLYGGADNCGNPPNGYPVGPPAPPGGFTSPPTPITFNDGTINNYYFNFSPPPAPLSPASFIPPVIINYFNASLNPEFKIPITFDFNGDINFGDGGGDQNFNQDDRDNIENIKNTTNNLETEITNIQNEINNTTNIENNMPPDPDDFEPPVTDQPPGEYSQTFLGAVTVDLTAVPVNAKTQSGDSAADIIYAGWFEWKQGNWHLPRQPIHFENNIFLAPKGVDGFGYTLYNGFDGRATSIIYKEKI